MARTTPSPLFLSMISITTAAALALGIYSYRSAGRLAERTTESVASANRVLGLKLIDRIEKVVIDTDRTFFQLVRLDDPKEFSELWRRIVRVSPAVQSVVVMDESHNIVHLLAKLGPKERRNFQQLFQQRIIGDLELDKAAPELHKHLHTTYDGKYYLVSYIRKRDANRDYFIALNMDLAYFLHDIFPAEFRELQESRNIAITDELGQQLYGQSALSNAQIDKQFVFDHPFPSTLYKWNLQLSPRDLEGFARQVRARRVSEAALVVITVIVLLLGLLILGLAIQKSQRANQLKSDFIANVSHELKTPLSLIRMFAELLNSPRVTATTTRSEYAAIIMRESDRLTALIDNVLDFARIERGKTDYHFKRGNLGTVVEHVIELVRYRSEQAGVFLRTQIDEGLPELLFDESAMTLLVLNLVENALKYGATRGTEVRIRLTRSDEHYLSLSVADDGPGIAKEEERRIFDRFYRGKTARSGVARGSGIGLSLVKHIAEAHKGRVRVESAHGKGALFEILLPL